MSRTILGVVVFLISVTGAQSAVVPIRGQEGYFFPPPSALYYFRPDLYIYRVTGPRNGYSPHCNYRLQNPSFFPLYSQRPWNSSYALDLRPSYRPHGIYRVIVDSPPTGGIVWANTSFVIFNVTPATALVYIDDKLIGSAGDFANERDRYMVMDGQHQLQIECHGHLPFKARLDVVPNKTLHFDIELEHPEP